MKLKDVKTFVTVPPSGIGGSFWVIVKVATDDGIEGIGECYAIPFSGDVACRMVEDTFERYVASRERIRATWRPCSGGCTPRASPSGRTSR